MDALTGTASLELVKIQKTSLFVDFMQRMVRTFSAKLGVGIMVIIILLCLVGPLFYAYGYNDIDPNAMFVGPSASHLLGCDSMGRDLLARIMEGGRYSLALGLITSVFSTLIAIVIGCFAGYVGGRVEDWIMRFMDVWSTIPAVLLCIIISSILGPGFFPTVLALTVGSVPGGVRMVRGQVVAERSKEYIEAAQAINCPKSVIMFKHLLPNVIQPMIILTTMGIGGTIMMASTLSYIGLGVQPPTPEWGALLAAGRSYIRTYPHMITFPGIFIALVVFAINLLGDGLRSALDPKLRN